jgi:D-xylose transport system permease protein
MIATEEAQVSQFALETTPGQGGLGEAASAYWEKVKGGDLGSLPAILGVIVLVIVFGVLEPDSFLTEQNFANLLNQGAAIIVLAMGLVFVLLLGEIDLSAGFTAGMGAAILGVTMTTHGWNWILAILAALPPASPSASRWPCWWPGWASPRSSCRWPTSWACGARCC